MKPIKLMKPFFFENSRVPVILSKLAPIEINAITLFCFVFSRGELSEKTKRHETIHFQQYLETFVIGFLLVYLYDFLYAAIIKKKGFTRESYLAIRFEQEAWECDDYMNYLDCRRRFAWLDYPVGGDEDLDVAKPIHGDKCKESKDSDDDSTPNA